MALTLTVTNRQRKEAVDIDKLQSMGEKLAKATLDALLEDKPKHLRKGDLKEMRRRAELSLVLVSNPQIRKLNKEWMGKDKPTDVLSFPLQLEAPEQPLPFELGEIVISVERAKEQAHEYGHKLDRELAFLFVHGLLHILGFDHMTEADEKDMFGRQKRILDGAGYKR